MSAHEMPVKLWAPWHPERCMGQLYGAMHLPPGFTVKSCYQRHT